MIEPLRLSFVVACPADHAFRTWTSKATAWWPPEHTVSHEEGSQVIFEPRLGGRIFERTASGREIPWGQITAWEPPRRLRYSWHIAADPADATDVEIAFVEIGTATRVEIEHRGWERLGGKGATWREINRGGWSGVLPAYERACVTAIESMASDQSTATEI